jgi:3,4-dihydroxy 2-butanone 4-phosphate synthase / GTP cyclohydrolase II
VASSSGLFKVKSTTNARRNNNNNNNGFTPSTITGNDYNDDDDATRLARELRQVAEYVAETKLPTDVGQFQLRAYRVPGAPNGQEPCVIYARDKPPMGLSGAANGGALHVPVRIHDQCLTSEVFRSQRYVFLLFFFLYMMHMYCVLIFFSYHYCFEPNHAFCSHDVFALSPILLEHGKNYSCDCKEQLHMALLYVQKHGGCIIYLQQEGRGIGLANKVAAYALQDVGLDTVDANLHLGFAEDEREYGVVRSILQDMRIDSIHLMTNNPRKVERLTRLGINVERTLPMVVAAANPYNRKYLETKEKRMHHANLAKILMSDPKAASSLSPVDTVRRVKNGVMAPRKLQFVADQYNINNGTIMSANAVQVSLMVEEDEDEMQPVVATAATATATPATSKEQQGVEAAADGYCFGRQTVLDAIQAIARGEMVVVVDDLNRENEGDFIMAADHCTDLDMAQIVRYSSGVVCVAMDDERMQKLNLPPMVTDNEDPKGTAFTVSVDARKEHGISTGISASDRATTCRLLADEKSTALDFARPGHIFPLRARSGGVLERDGHTEAAVDLAKLAGRSPAGILCEIVSEENPTEMMRLPEIKRFCRQHGYVLTSIVDLAQYRRELQAKEEAAASSSSNDVEATPAASKRSQ